MARLIRATIGDKRKYASPKTYDNIEVSAFLTVEFEGGDDIDATLHALDDMLGDILRMRAQDTLKYWGVISETKDITFSLPEGMDVGRQIDVAVQEFLEQKQLEEED